MNVINPQSGSRNWLKGLFLAAFVLLGFTSVKAQCDPSILYDKIVSGYHQSVALKSDGTYVVWGQDLANNGSSDVLSPLGINATNYPALTGTPLKVTIGGQGGSGKEQAVLLTSTGLFAWGTEDMVIETSLTSSATFQKISTPTGGDASTGLPTGVTPSSVSMMIASYQTLALLTNTGDVWVLSQASANLQGDGTAASVTTWHQVKKDASTSLSNVVAIRSQVSNGTYNAMMALTSAGEVYTWGSSVYLGDGNASVAKDYATLMTLPAEFSSSNKPKIIGVTGGVKGTSTTKNTFYILSNLGTLYALGANGQRQCGDFTTTEHKNWVNVQETAGNNFSDVVTISVQEHDASFPGFVVTTAAGDLYTCGENGGLMLGRSVDGTSYDPGFPMGFNSGTDKALFGELGGHTLVYIKEGTTQFCYVGHKVGGSMGDNDATDININNFNCSGTPSLSICGSVPVSADPTKSTITANPTSISAGGTSTSTITIQLKDASDNNLTSSGGTVTVVTDKGTLGTVTDNNDGTYTVTLTSSSSAETATISFKINGTAATATASVQFTATSTPLGTLTYSQGGTTSAAYILTKGTLINAIIPGITAGTPTSYSISPALPAGLSFNTTTGEITGTPTVVSGETTYTVSATDGSTTVTTDIKITVIDVAPSGLSYSTPNVYTKGTAITALNPTVSGGAVVSYSIAPTLPAGLSLNTTTGVISGTPTALSVATSYTVTATNTGGSTTATLSIAVIDAAPSGLSYATPNVYTKGTAITALNPTVSGGAVVSYSIAPTLPAGLSLNTTTGVISGTPTALSVATSYTVTATNTGGSTTATLSIAVIDAAPSGLSYATPNVYTKGTAITALNPTVSGGAVVSYSIAPTLPAGLSLNTTTGVISGTPTAVSAATSYTVTATNTGGSTTATLSITVNDAAPSGLNYTTPNTLYKGLAMTALNPTVSGGAVVSYSISPALSAGLSLNPTTGVISGTPTAMAAKVTYVITATNTGGSTSKSVDITVVDQPPLNLGYNPNPINAKRGITVVNSVPTSSGGTVISYSISPALPLGMSFNTTTGVISGTPTWDASPTTVYTIVATNSGGTASTTVTLNVSDDYALVVNNVITPNGDGYNDVWKIGNIAAYPDNEVWIYDRYGKLIYNRKNYNNEFNGKINGVALKTDTYYYVFKMNYPGVPVKKGYFTVVN